MGNVIIKKGRNQNAEVRIDAKGMTLVTATKTKIRIQIREAIAADVPRLREVIEASVRGLQAGDYSPAQIEGALQSVYGVDTQLIADGTYLAAEVLDSQGKPEIVGCGGWSKRKTLYGGDQYAGREDSLLDPAQHAAKIRAFFVHAKWARHGIGSLILEACENAALEAGFTRLEMGATLSGVVFYQAKGYAAVENQEVPLGNGEVLPIVKMEKRIVPPLRRSS
ncbi:MAG TPA: GNAT family N-acetyltransferase [Candidatus Acidoferrum sp.]|nr:GNAT family N-acetyltransferase [Candidatus Acidoferrum sp.]